MKRLCIFAHFDRDGIVDDYVYFYLLNLKRICTEVVFVTTMALNHIIELRLKLCCDVIITRENRGYDFISWQVGLQSEFYYDYDEIVLCNDSVYGPLYPLEDVFDAMLRSPCDFWGMTESRQISYHLQSYFLVFKKKVIVSETFRNFWSHLTIQESKNAVIRMYEVGLSTTLIEAGFKAGVFAKYSPSSLRRLKSLLIVCRNHAAQALRTGRVLAKQIIKSMATIIMENRRAKRATIMYSVSEFLKLMSPEVRQLTGRKASAFLYHTFQAVKMTLQGRNFNVSHQFWKELILQCKMPFIKIELLRDNPVDLNIGGFDKLIESKTTYDVDYIKCHLSRMKGIKTGASALSA